MTEVDPVAYLDSNVFIEAMEGPEAISNPIHALFRAMQEKRGALLTSELTLAEILGPSRGAARPADLRRRYIDLVVWSRLITLAPVSREVLFETVELRRISPLKLPDAIHFATAAISRCIFFVSRDRHFNRMPDWIEKLAPSNEAVERIVKAVA